MQQRVDQWSLLGLPGLHNPQTAPNSCFLMNTFLCQNIKCLVLCAGSIHLKIYLHKIFWTCSLWNFITVQVLIVCFTNLKSLFWATLPPQSHVTQILTKLYCSPRILYFSIYCKGLHALKTRANVCSGGRSIFQLENVKCNENSALIQQLGFTVLSKAVLGMKWRLGLGFN